MQEEGAGLVPKRSRSTRNKIPRGSSPPPKPSRAPRAPKSPPPAHLLVGVPKPPKGPPAAHLLSAMPQTKAASSASGQPEEWHGGKCEGNRGRRSRMTEVTQLCIVLSRRLGASEQHCDVFLAKLAALRDTCSVVTVSVQNINVIVRIAASIRISFCLAALPCISCKLPPEPNEPQTPWPTWFTFWGFVLRKIVK